MTCLILIRHGETDWNLEGRWQGQADVPLNARGREQAEQVARQLAGCELHAVYSSDLARARQTAEPMARTAGLEVRLEPRLREIDQGEWEGLLIDEIQDRYAATFQERVKDPWSVSPPGGETSRQVHDRVLAAVEEILQSHPGQNVAIVSHGFSLAVIITYFKGHPITRVWELVPKNCEVVKIEAPNLNLPVSQGR